MTMLQRVILVVVLSLAPPTLARQDGEPDPPALPVQGIEATNLQTSKDHSLRVFPTDPESPPSPYSGYQLFFGAFTSPNVLVEFDAKHKTDPATGAFAAAASCTVNHGWAMSIRLPAHPPIRSRRISTGSTVPNIVKTTAVLQDNGVDPPAAILARLQREADNTRQQGTDATTELSVIRALTRSSATACKPASHTSWSPVPLLPEDSQNPGAVVLVHADDEKKVHTVFVLHTGTTPGAISFFGSDANNTPNPNKVVQLASMQYASFNTTTASWGPVKVISDVGQMRNNDMDAYNILIYVQAQTGVCCFAP